MTTIVSTHHIHRHPKKHCEWRKLKPVIKHVAIPAILGMLILPLIVYNIYPDVFNNGYNTKANALIRKGCLGFILFKAGLGLDIR